MELNDLRDFLLSSRLISEDDFTLAVKEAREKDQEIEEILLNKGFLLEDDWRLAKAHILGVPFVDLTDKILSVNTLSIIPEPLSRRHNLVAYNKKGDSLEVALLDLDDLEAIDFLTADFKILPRLTNTESIKKALCQYQRNLRTIFGDLFKKEINALEKCSEPSDVVTGRIIELLLTQALRQRATAVFFEPTAEEIIVRYRVNNHNYEAMILPLKLLPVLTNKFKEIGDFKFDQTGQEINCRVSLLPTNQGERIVLRLLPVPSFSQALEEFDLSNDIIDKIYETLSFRSGLILVAGSEQAGLQPLLYSLLEIINQPDKNIFTIENNIIYQLPLVNQIPVRLEIDQTPAKILRRILKQDPDVVMISEIKDRETFELAVTAALSNHLIIAGVSADSDSEALEKILNFGLEQELVNKAIKLIIEKN